MKNGKSLSQYNLTGYSRGANQQEYFFNGNADIEVKGVIAPSAVLFFESEAYINFLSSAKMYKAYVASQKKAKIYTDGLAVISSEFIFFGNSIAEVEAKIRAAKSYYFGEKALIQSEGITLAGKDLFFAQNAEINFKANVNVGKDLPFDGEAIIAVDGTLQASKVDYLIMELDITIPAGGELRISSETFSIALGQQNVIHLQNGDWIFIERDTTHLIIEALGDPEIQGQLVCVERFL